MYKVQNQVQNNIALKIQTQATMEEEIKSVESIPQKQQSSFAFGQNATYAQMNKTYDDFDFKKSLISILMKLIPIFMYIILKFTTEEQLSAFILVSLLMAADFWTTKNILGPKLAGLKWYSIEDKNENEKWCFASCPETRIVSKINSAFFWFPQIAAIAFWIVIIFLNMITLGLFWTTLAIFSAFLLVLNLTFFLQCKGEHQNKVNYFAKKLGFQIYKKQQAFNQESIN